MLRLKFWGVRGSIPTPGPTTVRYGGNTACLELQMGSRLFILDAGSGIRALGQDLLQRNKPVRAHVFISHTHWDHIQGIPFFTPAYIPGNHIVFHGAEEVDKALQKMIADQMDPTYFPVEMDEMGAQLEFQAFREGDYHIDGVKVSTMYVNHPGNSLGYKFQFEEKSLVYISDNEPFRTVPDDKEDWIGEDGNAKLVEFIRGADVLIHDAQYTPEEYEKHVTWGHSPFTYTVELAIKGGVKKLFLFHHDPLHNDDTIDAMLANARSLAQKSKAVLEILAAKEGFVLEL